MKEENIVTVKKFTGKFKINDSYRPIAEALKKKYKELEYAPIPNILFIENLEDKRKKGNAKVYAQISKMPKKWEDIVYQITGKTFEYILEIFKENIWDMDRGQIVALIYHELRHIQLVVTEGSSKVDLVAHDIEDWSNMVEKLGRDWANTKATIPDLLDEDVDWDSIEGPPNFLNLEGIRLVK